MNRLFNEYGVDYIIHGDDPCILPDGSDAYALAKAAGRYKQIKRTEGVSSTDIVGRRLPPGPYFMSSRILPIVQSCFNPFWSPCDLMVDCPLLPSY